MTSELFERLKTEGEVALDAMVRERTSEGVDLEFKTKQRPENSDFEKGDKQALGACLSAFANSAGGTLIFGVRASRGPDGVDCARELVPIANIHAFASAAQHLVGQYLAPKHDGIRLHPIRRADHSGYLAIDVDRSERRPHMSKAPEDGKYYKRAGDSTFAMEHYDIEDAFRRYTPPLLDLTYNISSGMTVSAGNQPQQRQFFVDLFLTASNAAARFAFLHVTGTPLNIDVNSTPHHPMISTSANGERRFDAGADTLFHIGVPYRVCRLHGMVLRERGDTYKLFGVPFSEARVAIGYRIGAEGCRSVEGAIIVPHSEIATALGL